MQLLKCIDQCLFIYDVRLVLISLWCLVSVLLSLIFVWLEPPFSGDSYFFRPQAVAKHMVAVSTNLKVSHLLCSSFCVSFEPLLAVKSYLFKLFLANMFLFFRLCGILYLWVQLDFDSVSLFKTKDHKISDLPLAKPLTWHRVLDVNLTYILY